MKIRARKRFTKCEVCGNRSTRKNNEKRMFMAKFPLDEDRCREWVKRVGNEDLAYIPIEKLHQIKYVCGDHFLSKDFNAKKTRLRRRAIPSVFLKAQPLHERVLADFPCHLAKSDDESHAQPIPAENNLKLQVAQIKKSHNYSKPGKLIEHSYSLPPEKEHDELYKELLFGVPAFAKTNRTNVPHSTAPLISKLLTQQRRYEPEKEVFNCDKDDDDIQSDPSEKFLEGPFTWQREAITYADPSEKVPEGPFTWQREAITCADPSEKVPEGPFTWQREAITCADEEESIAQHDELRLTHKSKDAGEQAMLVDLETSVESEKYGAYRCDECGGDIVGVRYVCVQCADYDVCAPCEARGAHALHYALRVPIDKYTDEVLRVVEAVRKCINDDPSLILLPDSETVKIEVKDEEEQVMDTEYEADPLMVPPAQSAESCRRVPDLQPHLASGEHTEHTLPTAPLSTDIHTYNQPFIFNASSTQDTGQNNNEMYFLTNIDQKEGYVEDMSTESNTLTEQLIEVDDQSYSMASDDINDPFANVDRSNGEYTIRFPSSVARETKSNVKLKLVDTTKHLVKELTDLKFMKSNNLLIVIDRLDKSKLDKIK